MSDIKEALEISENELKKPRVKQTDHVLPFVSIFNPKNLRTVKPPNSGHPK